MNRIRRKSNERKENRMGTIRCFECGQKDLFELKEIEREYEGDGYHFTMMVKVPFCKKCGAYIHDGEIEDEIIEAANAKIRESRDILQRQDILEIVSKYDVSQKFLSRMLGWGEITLTRYINNNFTPNKANSDKLKSISDPYVLKRILDEQVEESEGEILNEVAFVRLRDSVNAQIDRVKEQEGKIFQVVNWFLSQSTCENRITHLALQKMLYFSQAWNSVFNNELLFEEDCEAWAHGAVYRNVYDKFKKFKYNPLPYLEVNVELSRNEIEVLEFVRDYYFDVYTPKTLELICHLETPYKVARKNHGELDRSGDVIDKDIIKKYYVKIANEYNISRNNKENVATYLNELLFSR